MAGETLSNTLAGSSGWLTKAFMGAAKLATVGLAAAVAWQVFLDPIFFPIFHDALNATAQAWVQMINTSFAWIPNLIGLTGDGGFLNTDFMQAVLAPYYDVVQTVPEETINKAVEKTGEALSLDSLEP